jgi:hypothetical protein
MTDISTGRCPRQYAHAASASVVEEDPWRTHTDDGVAA